MNNVFLVIALLLEGSLFAAVGSDDAGQSQKGVCVTHYTYACPRMEDGSCGWKIKTENALKVECSEDEGTFFYQRFVRILRRS